MQNKLCKFYIEIFSNISFVIAIGYYAQLPLDIVSML